MRVRIRYVSYIRRNKKIFTAFVSFFVLLMILIKLFMADITSSCQHSYPEPIDIVYTWVNGSDERFLSDLKLHLSTEPTSHSFDASQQRFCDKYELKFSLRSVELYAPWINHIFIVTNGQIPYWLDLDSPKVTLVTHSDIFLSVADLPTFSSPAIEAHLHRIRGVSKRFIYLNDDVFFGAPVYRDDFVSDSRGFLVYLAWPVPPCSADCPWLYVRDGQCDEQCLTDSCQMDGGDCDNASNSREHLHYSEPVDVAPTVKYLYEIEREKQQTRLNLTELLRLNSTSNVSLANVVHKLNSEFILLEKLTRKTNKFSKRKLNKSNNSTTPVPAKVEQIFDAFSESLQYCNRLFNTRYGYKARYVAAHAPILIDRNIMTSLQTDFHKEFALTSQHRLRTGTDLQYAFTYYNYLILQTKYIDAAYVFDMFDTDRSGTWSDREIRTVLTRLYDLPLDYGVIDHFEMVLLNCSAARDFPDVSTPMYERYIDSTLPTISKEMIISCPVLTRPLLASVGAHRRPLYPHTISRGIDTAGDSSDHQANPVTFKMLSSNLTSVINALDHIRRKPTKFVCINDNLDPAKAADNEVIVSILYDFYLSLFPLPSKFELAPELRNRFLHTDEFARWRYRNLLVKSTLSMCLILLVCTLVIKRCRMPFRVLAVTINKVV